ncbi:MAG: TrkH family potassium uptake protein [Clostridia bacterium]|nr:potassium transporter TrkG [Eubacteriales bacterium]MDD3867282.1 potassium transporter TrkG [Eubacteriales bacterium]MDD4461815.1 potassium transporter TrkG [Eubacteriales bacterium]NCC48709.1 TrkH family potassium uptake protein [Clostridia bacterium]
MNYRAVIRSLGIVMLAEAVFMIPSVIISLYYHEGDTASFLATILILLVIGFPLFRIQASQPRLFARDGFAIVALGWLVMSFFGALPFHFAGATDHFIMALFESTSGFTTTGASIFTDVESLPRGLVFWRSFTHWIGGMGVLLLTLAILPMFGSGALHILRAESPGPSPGKLVPKIGQTAKILYSLYIGLTLLQILLLGLAGVELFDALIHTFGSAGTGGFSNYNASVGAFDSLAVELIIGVFVLLFGVSFTLHYQLVRGRWRDVVKDAELRLYALVVLGSILIISWSLYSENFASVGGSLRQAFFQVASIVTTTGYATADFNNWPLIARIILVALMLIGPCAGSTGGGIKMIRLLMVGRIIRREMVRIKHPQSFHTVQMGGKAVDERILHGVSAFILFYMLIMLAAILLVAPDSPNLDTAVTSVIACISNIGPGLGAVGPIGNYAGFSPFSQAVLSLCMVIGRLEIFPVMILFMPSFWRRISI